MVRGSTTLTVGKEKLDEKIQGVVRDFSVWAGKNELISAARVGENGD